MEPNEKAYSCKITLSRKISFKDQIEEAETHNIDIDMSQYSDNAN